jgi:hypothetical protein
VTLRAPEADQHCPECGASQRPLTCRARLELLLAWEVDDAPLRELHFLTVASYNLQHPAVFTDDARLGLERAFAGYLEGRLTIGQIRRQATAVSGATRVHRPPSDVHPVRRSWAITIDGVAVPGHAAEAADRVRIWAESIHRALTAG